MKDDQDLSDAIKFMALNREVNKRKNELDKAIINNNEDDILNKRSIYNKVKETMGNYVK